MTEQFPGQPPQPGSQVPPPTAAYPQAPAAPYPAAQPSGPYGGPPAPPPAAPVGPDAPRSARAWYQKKRFLIPGGIVLLAIIGGIAGGGDGDTPSTAAGTQQAAEDTADAKTAKDVAADEEAQRQSEEDAAAEEARKAEAERVAEEQRVAEEAAAAEAAAAEAARIGSVAQQNAYRSANQYLDYTAFSRSGLVHQLEFEGFATADAEFAIARLEAEGGVDWNAQAAASAANYLDYTSFSRSGLVEQLVFEGFSPEQAEYGVSTTGL